MIVIDQTVRLSSDYSIDDCANDVAIQRIFIQTGWCLEYRLIQDILQLL